MFVPPILVAFIALTAALAAGATALSRPRLTLAILFLLASFSRVTLGTPLGTMRLEMPAIAVVAAVLFAGGRFSTLRSLPRSTVAMGLAFATYLAVLAFSSAFVAPGTDQSLHMVAWLATSMLGGIVAFILVRPRPVDAIEPVAIAGAVMGAIGIVAAIMFLVAGPAFAFGIQDPNGILPRVYALGWEANLYAFFLGMSAFFALEVARGPRKVTGFVMVALVLVGFPLGVTRAAYLGLAAGFVGYVAVRLAVERRPADLQRLATMSAALLVVGIVATSVLLPNVIQRSSGGILGPGPSIAGRPTFAPDQYADTLAFRLDRVPIALDDFQTSPLIGLGAESFGQRHPDRSAGGYPDHIAIMGLAVLYEAGLIGATALLIGFVLLLRSLWNSARRSSRSADWRSVGAAAAFIGSVTSILVAYQSNNALHLAVTWIIIGAATALTAPVRQGTMRTPSAMEDCE